MHTCYIGIGSNLDNPVEKARQAIESLKVLNASSLISVSSLYCSKPMGPSDQPDYINAVVKLETSLTALALLDELQQIELTQGRERKDERWGPRTLDLDILLIDNLEINNDRLTVPHYGMCDREFVLYPLFEIAPELVLPNNKPLSILVKNCPKNGLEIFNEMK